MKQYMLREYLFSPLVGIGMVKENRGVEAQKFRFGNSLGQYYLYHEPEGEPKDIVIVYIHGGGWKRGVPSLYKCVANSFAKRGYHTISLGYRLAPFFKYPTQGYDVAMGYSKAIEMLNKKGVSTDKIVVVGASAGAHLGGVLAYDKNLHKKYDIDSKKIKGFISLGGILKFDVTTSRYAQGLFKLFFKKGYDRTKAEPYSLVDKEQKTKVLCVHSAYDPVSSFKNSKQFVEKVNLFNEGLGECHLIDNKDILHTNLVSGVFLAKGPAVGELKTLFDWLGKL